jgi:hypothetical protein
MRKVQVARALEALLIRRSRTVAREWAELIADWQVRIPRPLFRTAK